MLAAGYLGFAGMGLLLGVPVEIRLPARRRESRLARRRRWLRQAGATVSPAGFYTVSVVVGGLVFALGWLLTSAWPVALVPAVMAALAPHSYWTRQRKRQLAAVRESWPDGLRDLAASANARLPLHQALGELARSGPAPLRSAFAAYPANARVMGVIPALEHIKEQLADPTSDRILEVLILVYERGPAGLGAILEELARSTSRDLRTEQEIDLARQEPRIAMWTTAVAPWLVLIGLTLPDTFYGDYFASGRGLGAILMSATLTFAGIALVRRLSRDPVECRLFDASETADGS